MTQKEITKKYPNFFMYYDKRSKKTNWWANAHDQGQRNSLCQDQYAFEFQQKTEYKWQKWYSTMRVSDIKKATNTSNGELFT